jgi:hypothetical protein
MTRHCNAILIILACTAWIPRAEARRIVSDRLAVPGDSGVMELPVHPAIMTMLYFPEPIERVIRSDEQNFLVGAKGTKLGVRPLPDAPVGTQASLSIITKTMRVGVRLEVVADPRGADVQVSFVRHGVDLEPAPPIRERLAVHLGAWLGRAWIGDTGTAIDTVHVGGLTGRLMVRGSRFHAYEASLTVGQTTPAQFSGASFPQSSGEELSGELERASLLVRLSLGASVRLPTRLFPVVHVNVGAQRRSHDHGVRVVGDSVFEAFDDRAMYDLTGSVGLGLNYQVSQTWVIGLGIHATHALPIDGGSTYESLEGAIHVGF